MREEHRAAGPGHGQTADTLIAAYHYDGRNYRIAKVLPNGENWDRSDYYYNENWQVLEERTITAGSPTMGDGWGEGDMAVHVQWLWDVRYIDTPVLRWRDADADPQTGLEEVLYYANDANMNVTALVDATPGSQTVGQVVERYVYDPYGRATVYNGDWSADLAWTNSRKNEVTYCGYRFDAETQLHQVRWRYYLTTTGAWASRDPLFNAADPTADIPFGTRDTLARKRIYFTAPYRLQTYGSAMKRFMQPPILPDASRIYEYVRSSVTTLRDPQGLESENYIWPVEYGDRPYDFYLRRYLDFGDLLEAIDDQPFFEHSWTYEGGERHPGAEGRVVFGTGGAGNIQVHTSPAIMKTVQRHKGKVSTSRRRGDDWIIISLQMTAGTTGDCDWIQMIHSTAPGLTQDSAGLYHKGGGEPHVDVLRDVIERHYDLHPMNPFYRGRRRKTQKEVTIADAAGVAADAKGYGKTIADAYLVCCGKPYWRVHWEVWRTPAREDEPHLGDYKYANIHGARAATFPYKEDMLIAGYHDAELTQPHYVHNPVDQQFRR